MLILVGLCAGQVFAQDDVPDSSGFSGFLAGGPGYAQISTNVISSGAPFVEDVGYAKIESLYKRPEAKWSASTAIGGEINYTFGKARTQLFFGTRLEDILRMDVAFGAGIRKELKDKSIIAASFLFTPLKLKYYSDPFIEGQDREKSALDRPGVRLRWGRMFNTGLELTLTVRDNSLETETSGTWLVENGMLYEDDISKLNRNGLIWRTKILYRFYIKKRHRFEPTFRYALDDRNGGAVAGSSYSFKMTYLFITKRVILDLVTAYGRRTAKELHPVFDKTYGSDRFGLAINAIFPVKMYKTSRLNLFIGVEYLDENANIDFYSNEVRWINAGVLWRHVPK